MAKKNNQKLKLLYLADIFKNDTDEEHPLTLQEIVEILKSNDIPVDRKTLYQDFEALREYGYDIICDKRGRSYYYYQWNVKKEQELRHNGKLYKAIPWGAYVG